MKKPTKPTLKKFPKQPKMTATKEVWDRYEKKLKEIKAENARKMAEYKRKLKAYEAEMARRQKIKALSGTKY